MNYLKHPCIDNVDGKLSLKIFRFFFLESSLPKYQHNYDITNEDMQFMSDINAKQASSFDERENNRKIADYINSKRVAFREKLSFWQKILFFFKKEDTALETFKNIKDTKATLSPELKKAIEGVDKLIERAKKSGQLTIIEKLEEHKNILAQELVLSEKGFDKFVSEDSIIEFIQKSERGVSLDYLRNYTTFLPFDVIDIKTKLDELQIFDNYCVLHYDPKLKPFQPSHSEEELVKKRDPILFGLIKGSRKLYFIADWITEEDDLTLDELNIVVEGATERLANYNAFAKDFDVNALVESIKNFVPAGDE